MDRTEVLRIIESYLKDNRLVDGADDLAKTPVTRFLTSSLDVVELVMHLEEALGLKAEIDLDVLGPRLARDLTVEELADEVVRLAETLA